MSERIIIAFLVLLFTMFTLLCAQIGEPIKINQENEWIYSTGQKGIRYSDNTIHLTYSKYKPYFDDAPQVVYTKSVEPFINYTTLEIAETYDYWRPMFGNPVLELMSDGRVLIFYPLAEIYDNMYNLMKTEISPEGIIVSTESIYESVYTTAAVVNDEDNIHLLFKNGFEHEAEIMDYQYFSNIFRSLDDVEGNVRFYGQDVIHGRVHSNTDIWIRQIGGGDNNGWPTFYGLVTTTGFVQVYGGGAFPIEQVFRGGLIEDYYYLELPAGADLIRQNGIRPFGSIESDDKIYFVTINGSTYTSMIGQIVLNTPQEFTLYSSYPPYGPIGDLIDTYQLAIPDTVWVEGPSGIVNNQSVFVPGELWISGSFGGLQTWGSSHNIYIKDDLTYQNTIVGQPPDGGVEGEYPVNETDVLALVSEKSILIQYGYRDPADGMRYKPNCDNVNIYGYLFALGDGQGETTPAGVHYKDGIFSFQYQFPKGSTPDQMFQGDFYTQIDLNLRRYPTSSLDPWPPGLDYPWYNPLWPEPGPIFSPGAPYSIPIPNPHGAPSVTYLRGSINLFGGFASRRYGYIRRSGNADYDTGIWDIDNHFFGHHSNGLTPPGGASGYDKNYFHDSRLEYLRPLDVPSSSILDGAANFAFHYWRQEEGSEDFSPVLSEDLIRFKDNLLIDAHNNRVAILMSNNLLLSDETGSNFQEFGLDITNDSIIDLVYSAEGIFILSQDKLQRFDPGSYELFTIDERILPNWEQGIATDVGNVFWAASINEEIIQFNVYNPTGDLLDQYDWQHGIVRHPGSDFENSKSPLGLIAQDNQIFVTLHITLEEDIWGPGAGELYLATGILEYQSVDTVELVSYPTLYHYPNPVYRNRDNRSQAVNINFNLPQDSYVKINIYNIKGQLVKNLINENFSQGDYTLQWDGRDSKNKIVAQGIYFYELVSSNSNLVRKILILN